MYATERQQRILAQARDDGRVEVAALAEDLSVTPETIRRDLTALEQRGSVRRVHGGAIPVERLVAEPTLASRSAHLPDVKRRIAARIMDELPAGGTILLDAGSTTHALIDLLPDDATFTILTNSIPAAAALAGRPGLTLYVLGGRVRGVTAAAVGDWASAALKGVVVDVAVIGTNGISAARGLTTPDQAEAEIKRAMVTSARRVIVATDSTKAGDDHLHRFASLAEVDLVVTDADLSEDVLDELREAGPEVVTA
ncbi:DeoR/GlpR family DNA-binding transcription regulator [Demequina sp. SYSU T00039]|uniref:Lactose phosphotransferase system repressor n=1 Tax=Demequina lignilytica TaxID=3051663 RepID=A0AAW7M2X3_9MICO|nr:MULTISPECIES: DeoR/GlpR family DNA-binding transcription regulator [unclassified Demequina]MDN4477610.1 DeoR/GlpR family DNA-binding transcription regulator [Demequina sp. SYSU T00039-1]MDN4488039.1 DeoR/GlpR family DNA-binding transcription regulator [Demequina sp. SYSU T00039]MDN4490479.1 DeoR/GlpR family DNA-binding transcription regulator [Demequina sp. SYSU T00068]